MTNEDGELHINIKRQEVRIMQTRSITMAFVCIRDAFMNIPLM